jgi:hypothetical protein
LSWSSALWLAGVVLVLLGAERLLNVALLPRGTAAVDARLTLAWASIGAGALLLGVAGLGLALRRRR